VRQLVDRTTTDLTLILFLPDMLVYLSKRWRMAQMHRHRHRLDVTVEYKYRLQQHHNFPHLQQLNLSM
jgi:hypothetical protein